MNIGPMIRRHRKDRRLTLKTVAAKAGISEGFLSQVENNVNSPSVDTLIKVCNAIGINAGDLLNKAENQQKLNVIRKANLNDVEIPRAGFVTRRFIPPENRTVLDSAVLILSPGKSIPIRKNIKTGQELLCMIQGTLELTHGDQTVTLKEGDAAHYWVEPRKQVITNRTEKTAVVFWVGTL
ncbi:MAG: XRE family transcriptional regulator [Desulfobacterales bacterium]